MHFDDLCRIDHIVGGNYFTEIAHVPTYLFTYICIRSKQDPILELCIKFCVYYFRAITMAKSLGAVMVFLK